jgi:uncharacterized membrane protein
MNEAKKKYVSPSKRAKPWVTVALRKESYDKLAELAAQDQRTIGGQMSWFIDMAYEQLAN